MIALIAALGLLNFLLASSIGVSKLLYPGPRPPRHARPKGWTGPAERAPFPPVPKIDDEMAQALRVAMHRTGHPSRLSPLNREVMRRRFRVMWWQSQGRPVV